MRPSTPLNRSGMMFTEPPGCHPQWKVFTNRHTKHLSPKKPRLMEAPDLDDCLHGCLADPKCVGFQWIKVELLCSLHRNVDDFSHRVTYPGCDMYLLVERCAPDASTATVPHPTPPTVACTEEELNRCVSDISKAFGLLHRKFLQLTEAMYVEICNYYDEIKNCVDDLRPLCRVPYPYEGLMSAYEFLCPPRNHTGPNYLNFMSSFLKLPPRGMNCFGRYPQVLAEFLDYVQLRPSDFYTITGGRMHASRNTHIPENEIIVYDACMHLSTTRDMFCKEFTLTMLFGN